MEKMKKSVTTLRPAKVYMNLDDSLEGPRNIKQIYNAKAWVEEAGRQVGTHARNFAEQGPVL